MNIKDFYLKGEQYFKPRTPNAAIRGIKKGLIPKESFIAISLFLYSPFSATENDIVLSDKEEIQRIQELERLLAKKNMSMEMEIQLISTLDKLVDHNNSEIALFAAESINSLENRYNKIIYKLKEQLEQYNLYDDRITLINTLYKYGVINQDKSDIKEFYFKELLGYIDDDIYKYQSIVDLLFTVYKDLKLFDKADELLKTLGDKQYDPCEIKVMEISLCFAKGDFFQIFKILERSKDMDLPERCREELLTWLE